MTPPDDIGRTNGADGRVRDDAQAEADTQPEPSRDAAAEPEAAPPAPQPQLPPPLRRHKQALYILAALVIGCAQGLGMNLVSANIQQIQGAIGTTSNEAYWLVAAYMAPNASLTLALIKLRTQFGLRPFAELSILFFVGASMLNLTISDLPSAIFVRFASGCAAAPLSTLIFLYCLEAFPPAKKLTAGLGLALIFLTASSPIARIISPSVFELHHFHGLSLIEAGMALIAFGFVYLLPLAPTPRDKVIHWVDIVSYLLIATGLGALAVVLTMGRFSWWLDAPWVGWTLALGIGTLAIAVMIELNRDNPLLDIRWIVSPAILHFTATLMIFRMVMTEQTPGATGLFQALGLTNQQTVTFYVLVLLATLSGGLACITMMERGWGDRIHVLSLSMIAGGAYMDSQATSLTRPEQMLLSQALIAFGGALFLPPVMRTGLIAALQRGPNYILSFVIVFLMTQRIGSLLGSAVVGTYVQMRRTAHTEWLYAGLQASDPLVTARVAQYAASYARVIPDSATRQSAGLGLLDSAVGQQATVLAYNDTFRIICHLALAALALLLGHMGAKAWQRRRDAMTAASAAPG